MIAADPQRLAASASARSSLVGTASSRSQDRRRPGRGRTASSCVSGASSRWRGGLEPAGRAARGRRDARGPAVAREMFEETGLIVPVGARARVLDRIIAGRRARAGAGGRWLVGEASIRRHRARLARTHRRPDRRLQRRRSSLRPRRLPVPADRRASCRAGSERRTSPMPSLRRRSAAYVTPTRGGDRRALRSTE